MVRSAKVQNFLKPERNCVWCTQKQNECPPWRVFWHSRVASGLKCWPMSQCRDKLPLSMGFKSLSTDSTVAVRTGSASIDLKHPTETQQQTERKARRGGEEEKSWLYDDDTYPYESPEAPWFLSQHVHSLARSHSSPLFSVCPMNKNNP